MERIFNVHTHVFNGLCAPDYFLRTALPRPLKSFASQIKVFITKPGMRGLMKVAARIGGGHQLLRAIEFIEMGLQERQADIFLKMRNAYSFSGPPVRFITLILNMDHMGPWKSVHANIHDQLGEVERLRIHYPDEVFPFIGIDPREHGGRKAVQFVEEYFRRLTVFGIKLYPSLGFFPFDERLDELYAWAQENEVPIMTHCTRQGVHYLGEMKDILLDLKPQGVHPEAPEMKDIHQRIERFRKSKVTWGDPKYGCNIFTHPQNYYPVLRKFPRLKICLAHFGGSDEVLGAKQHLVRKKLDGENWHHLVKELLEDSRFPNVYTDISYTLYDEKVYAKLGPLMSRPFADRILFGTDFYMTLKECTESQLLERCINGLSMSGFRKVASKNPEVYLRSRFFEPQRSFTNC